MSGQTDIQFDDEPMCMCNQFPAYTRCPDCKGLLCEFHAELRCAEGICIGCSLDD